MPGVIVIALVIVAGVLGLVELSRSQLQSLPAWAILALAVALLVGRLG